MDKLTADDFIVATLSELFLKLQKSKCNRLNNNYLINDKTDQP